MEPCLTAQRLPGQARVVAIRKLAIGRGAGAASRIAVAKSLALYRERPGAVNFEGERECSGRGVRDTAICSKPSASLSMGIEWSRPSRERRAKGTWVDFVTHRLRNIGGGKVSGRVCWRGVGLREGWASTRKPGAVERSKWLSRDCIGSDHVYEESIW